MFKFLKRKQKEKKSPELKPNPNFEENKDLKDGQIQNEEEEEKLVDNWEKEMNSNPILIIKKSDFFSPQDREILQYPYLQSLKTKGLFFQVPEPIDKEKLLLLKCQKSKKEVSYYKAAYGKILDKKDNLSILDKKDGLYVKGSDSRLLMDNIHRFQQRFLSEEKDDYFKDDCELNLDNDIVEDKLTKILDISFVENPALRTFHRNAIMSQRLNQQKSQYFELDITIGKLILTNHPGFSLEEQQMAQLKKLLREYKERADLALIPHFETNKDLLKKELNRLQALYNHPVQNIELIKNELLKNEERLEKEVHFMQELMERIYIKWEDVKKTREFQRFISTPFNLKVRSYSSIDQTKEFEFLLENINLKDDPGTRNINKRELSRRNNLSRQRVFLRLLVNGKYVTRTKKKFIDWPSFEAHFQEKFQLYLFTKPSSIKIQVVFGLIFTSTIATLEIPIPGENSNTLTSSASIYQEIQFSRKKKIPKILEKKDNKDKNKNNLFEKNVENQETDPLLLNTGDQAIIDIEKLAEVQPFEGRVLFKGEWVGFGPSLPPKNMETIAGKSLISSDVIHKIPKGLSEYEKNRLNLNEPGFHIDLNDPRNELIADNLRLLKNKELRELLKKEEMLPFYDLISLRETLLKLRYSNPDVLECEIPLNEENIVKNQRLMRLLEDSEKEMRAIEDLKATLNNNSKLFMENLRGEYDEKFPQNEQTIERIIKLRKILIRRQKFIRLSQSMDSGLIYSLKSIVNEFTFAQAESPFKACLRALFTQRRKLGVVKKKEKKFAHNEISEISININLIKGRNVPIREAAAATIRNIAHKRKELNFNLNYSAGGYGNPGYYNPQGMLQQSMPPGMMGNYPTGMSRVMRDENIRMIATAAQNIDELSTLERVYSFVQVKLVQEIEKSLLESAKILKGSGIDHSGLKVMVQKTDCMEGMNPEWNQILRFKISPNNKNGAFSAREIANSRNVINISLFDALGSIKNRRDNPNKFTMLINKHFLGNISIPLISILENKKIEAAFKINRPIILFGYYNSQVNLIINQFSEEHDLNITNPAIPTYIHLNLSIDPVIEIPSLGNEADYFPGFEDTQFLIMGSYWLDKIKRNKIYGKRFIKLWGEDINGHSVFIPRYITKLKPYLNLDDNEGKDEFIYEKIARFVSLIPFKNDSENFSDLPDIWSTCQQFIDLKAGDYEEHAILLCNYFNYLDFHYKKTAEIKNYLLFGRGVPEGKTVYVLRRNIITNEAEIWNACTGEPYYFGIQQRPNKCLCFTIAPGFRSQISEYESHCPLKEIGSVANNENIWVNIQSNAHPGDISYNIENKKFWMPFLGEKSMVKYFPSKTIQTVQNELIYEEISTDFLDMLEYKIQDFLRKKIEETRRSIEGKLPFPTKFNGAASEAVKKYLLVSLESFRYTIRISGQNSGMQGPPLENNKNIKYQNEKALKELFRIRDDLLTCEELEGKMIYGFPINMSFVDFEKVWEQVKNTEIHEIFKNDIEYVCAVKCFGHTNYIISTWVFIAILI